VSASPAGILTAAIALALLGGCAVAPSPTSSVSPTTSSSAPAVASSPLASASPSPLAGSPLLVAWERRGDEVRLIIVRDGTIGRLSLPAVPNGPVAAGLDGPLAFLSGSPDKPVLWIGGRSLSDPRWEAQPLVSPEPQDGPVVWLCLSPGSRPRVAMQSDDNLVYLVDDGGRLLLLPPGLLMLRPGGCAWSDRSHLIVTTDVAQPTFHVGFAIFDVDAGTFRLPPGTGGEAPAVSDVSLAYVVRDPAGRQVVWIGDVPSLDDPVPLPDVLIAPDAPDVDFFHPTLSADGRRLAVIELARPAVPRRLLVYELFPNPAVVMQLDVRGASDAGPAWIANAPAD
jgi:hypothetical protein